MIDETFQKTYSPLKLAEVGKSYQHENIMDKEKNVKDNDEFLEITAELIFPYSS